jgi:hypothetical protein
VVDDRRWTEIRISHLMNTHRLLHILQFLSQSFLLALRLRLIRFICQEIVSRDVLVMLDFKIWFASWRAWVDMVSNFHHFCSIGVTSLRSRALDGLILDHINAGSCSMGISTFSKTGILRLADYRFAHIVKSNDVWLPVITPQCAFLAPFVGKVIRYFLHCHALPTIEIVRIPLNRAISVSLTQFLTQRSAHRDTVVIQNFLWIQQFWNRAKSICGH